MDRVREAAIASVLVIVAKGHEVENTRHIYSELKPMSPENGHSIISRRQLRAGSAAAAVATTTAATKSLAAQSLAAGAPRIHFALNTSTIRGQKLSVPEQVEVAANAGYDGIEPW